MGFLLDLNEAVRGKALSDPCPASPAVEALLEVCLTGNLPVSVSHTHSRNGGECVWTLLLCMRIMHGLNDAGTEPCVGKNSGNWPALVSKA